VKALLAILLLVAAPAWAQERLVVFAAASLKDALDEANRGFGDVTVSYGASSTLARQIERGAPAQAFISADLEWMDYLDAKGAIVHESRRNLLGNRLVWIVPATSALPAEPLLALGASGRLALADPRYVPAGKYARAALEKLGLWDRVSTRIAPAENVRAALAFVARGEAPLGIVYQTDAREEPRVRVAGRIDPAAHPPIVYPAALVRGAGPRAMRYLDYLGSPEARAIFAKHGFTPLN
jgi:molybdate transport system substrate-binding protein